MDTETQRHRDRLTDVFSAALRLCVKVLGRNFRYLPWLQRFEEFAGAVVIE